MPLDLFPFLFPILLYSPSYPSSPHSIPPVFCCPYPRYRQCALISKPAPFSGTWNRCISFFEGGGIVRWLILANVYDFKWLVSFLHWNIDWKPLFWLSHDYLGPACNVTADFSCYSNQRRPRVERVEPQAKAAWITELWHPLQPLSEREVNCVMGHWDLGSVCYHSIVCPILTNTVFSPISFVV